MVSRVTAASVLLVGVLVPATFAMNGDSTPHRQSAIVSFERPTWVAGEMLIGTYVIVHDDDKMAGGAPCTAFYRVGPRHRPLEEVVAFHCIPRERKAAPGFTTTVISKPALRIDTFDTLSEFQFAGDSEGHGVPVGALVSDRPQEPDSVAHAR
jgi:hypothetical protein